MEIQTSFQLGLLLAPCEINDTSNDKLFDHTFFRRHRVFFVGGDKPEIKHHKCGNIASSIPKMT